MEARAVGSKGKLLPLYLAWPSLALSFAFIAAPLVPMREAHASCTGAENACSKLSDSKDFAELDLEDMLNVVITSVSKMPQNLRETAAAVYVLTGEEIRESGATSLGDALRIVPGLDVAQIDGSRFAISARGFHRYFANKMLVLIDGRSLYTPLFAGTVWEQWDVFLDDLDRIEVIRGPGGTTWGANAVNGVINIITKSARDTTGLLVRQAGGSDTYTYTGGRWGGKLSDNLWYRLYLQHTQDSGVDVPTTPRGTQGGRVFTTGGFRIDGDLTEQDSILAHGELSRGEIDQLNVIAAGMGAPKVEFDDEMRLGHILLRVDHSSERWGSAFFQSYYDSVDRNINVVGSFRAKIATFDTEFQHRLPLFAGNEATWGLAYRWYDFNISKGENISFGTIGRTNILSAKIADEWRITDKLKIGAGTKVENNSFTGTEIEPRVHASYSLTGSQTLWASISRAVRIPSLLNNSLVLRNTGARVDPESGTTILFTFKGTPATKSEKLIAYEVGWRGRIKRRAEFDLALFFNDYRDMEDFASVLGERRVISVTPPIVEQDLDSRNIAGAGHSFGGEIMWRVQITPWWHTEVSYAFEKFKNTVDRRDPAMPDHKVNLRQRVALPMGIQATATLNWVDKIQIRSEGGKLEKIDSFARFDLAVQKWFWDDRLLLEVVGQNLIEGKHTEHFEEFQTATPVTLDRRIWGGVSYRY